LYCLPPLSITAYIAGFSGKLGQIRQARDFNDVDTGGQSGHLPNRNNKTGLQDSCPPGMIRSV